MTDAISGFLIVDKPVGVTSFSIVALVRRLTGVRRVGHAGTLDPLASGVLPVAVGQATRLIEYLDDELKTYIARVRFGVATDTYDAEGAVTTTADGSFVTDALVERELQVFVGDIEQTPPLYSALKVAGKPLYRYAREGEAVDVASRVVHVERVALLSFDDGVAEIEVVCGKGTYIRSIAHDLGARIGCGAHLAALRRTSTGGFALDDAHSAETLSAFAADGRVGELMLAPDRALERRRAAILAASHHDDMRAGRAIELTLRAGVDAAETGEVCRAYSTEGGLIGVLQLRESGLWHPAKVLARGGIEQNA